MPLRADLLQPIPGDSPGGISLRYDPIYDKIKEARREDVDLPQGAWQRTLKVADHAQVVKLTGEALATKSKDLQLAVWLVESIVRREGFAVLPSCFKLLHDLNEQFWDSLFPEIEDGDLELRAGPLDWVGSKFEVCLRELPITSEGLSWFKYKESRAIGYENDASSESKMQARNEQLADGKISAERFDQSVDDSPRSFYENLQAHLTASIEHLTELGNLCDAKFGSDSPSFLKTQAALEEIGTVVRIVINKKGSPTAVEEAPEPEPLENVEPAEEYVQSVVSTGNQAAAVRRAPQTVSKDPVDVADAGERIAAAARFLRQQDAYNVAPYMILRGFRWGEIRCNGSNIDPNMLVAPSGELRSTLKRFALEQDWDNVLETTETAMEQPCGRAWLDVQRYAVRALENKGEYFAYVAQAIRTGLRNLLQDLPGLLELTLIDDTPTANPETLAWIKQDILPPSTESASEAPDDVLEIETPVPEPVSDLIDREVPSMEQDLMGTDEVFEAALSRARAGYLHEAVEIISNELATERTGRGRFKRRVQLTHLMVAAGKNKIAYPILKQLAVEIDARHLEEWESGAVLSYPLGLLLECARQEDEATIRDQTYARICQIDPLFGLKYGD